MPSRDKPKPSAGASGSVVSGTTGAGNVRDLEMLPSSIGSGLLARQPTPAAEEQVTVVKVCPQCGTEYETGDRFCPRDGAPLRPKSLGDPMIGRVIADRYLILALLGEGGMGRVYVAEHVKMNRQCAIKVMSPSLINDGESTTRFAREASNAARILHPNVAAVFDFGESDKTVYLVMEYVDGESLSSLLAREGPLDPRRSIDLARQIADGLSAAHELGIIHRDLKPDNVIVSRKRDGREVAKVVDFGIAKAVSDSPKDSLTRSGLVIGTPEYMSPEQLIGDPVDARTDVYALGCMLYQMLTGMKPFDADTREQMIRRRLHDPPPHVREHVPAVPRRIDTLIAHMLARSPAERLSSAAEASAALDPALALSGWDPSGPSPGVPLRSPRGAPTVLRPAADPSMQPTMPMKIQRPNAARIAIGASVGSALLLGGLFVWSQRELSFATPLSPALTQAQATPRPQPTGAAASPGAGLPPKPTATSNTSRGVAHPGAGKVAPPPAATVAANRKKPAATDTATKAPGKPAAPATPESPDQTEIRQALDHFAVAMGNGEVAIHTAFPEMPPTLLEGLRTFFATAQNVHAKPLPGEATITGDHAEVPLTLKFDYQRRGSTVTETFQQSYQASLTRRFGHWQLSGLSKK